MVMNRLTLKPKPVAGMATKAMNSLRLRASQTAPVRSPERKRPVEPNPFRL